MNIHAQWIVGFTDGEGCFYVGISPSKSMTLGFRVIPTFSVTQHKKDIKVLYGLKTYFGCGTVYEGKGNDCVCKYRVADQKNLFMKIVPFFEKHPLKTSKHLNFLKFREIIQIMARGEHLKPEGLDRIQKIKSLMNIKYVDIE